MINLNKIDPVFDTTRSYVELYPKYFPICIHDYREILIIRNDEKKASITRLFWKKAFLSERPKPTKAYCKWKNSFSNRVVHTRSMFEFLDYVKKACDGRSVSSFQRTEKLKLVQDQLMPKAPLSILRKKKENLATYCELCEISIMVYQAKFSWLLPPS